MEATAPDAGDALDHSGGRKSRDSARSWIIVKMAIGVVMVLALGALWTWGPLRDLARSDRIVELTEPFAQQWWAKPAAVASFALGALLLAPMTLLMVVLVLLFGAWQGFFVAWLGATLSAALGHTVGRYFWNQSIGRHVRKRWSGVAAALSENEIRATIIVRLIPVAPFTLVNLLAGSVRIRLRNFLLGTVVGAIPFLAVLAFASDRIVQAVSDPTQTSIGVALAIIVALAALGVLASRLAASDP